MNKKLLKTLISILFIMIGINLSSSISVNAKTIKVGYIDYPGFIEKNDDGSYEGYGVEYLKEISKYTNWKYKFVEDTWANILEKLRNGRIDIICQAEKTPERVGSYLFSDFSVGTEYTIVYANNDSDIYYKDMQGMNNAKVGLLKDGYQLATWKKYAKKNNIKYYPVYYDTETEMIDALKQKKIDIVATGSIPLHSDLKVVDRFNPEPFYIVTGTMNKKIINSANSALAAIRNDSPYFQQQLQEKYYSENAYSTQPLLTREENDYIKKHKNIVVGLVDNCIPYSYKNNGKDTGIFYGLLNLISEKTGMNIKIKYVDNASEFLKSDNCFFLGSSDSQGKTYKEDKYWYSNNIFNVDQVVVKKKKQKFNIYSIDTVAVPKHTIYAKKDSSIYKKKRMQLVKYDTMRGCFEAVRNGETDVALCDIYSANYYMQSKIYTDELSTVSVYNESSSYCMIASKEMDNTLKNIMNKIVASMSDSQVNQICVKYSNGVKYKPSFKEFIRENSMQIQLVALIVVLIVVLAIVIINRRTNMLLQQQEMALLKDKAEKDEMTGFYNIATFYEKVGEKLKETNEKYCIVNLNINRLKVINDIYGMEEGDKLIKYLADKLFEMKKGRDDIIISRASADNFFIFMSEEDYNKNEVVNTISHYSLNMKITVRAGVYSIEDKSIPINIMCDRAVMASENVKKGLENVGKYNAKQGESIIFEQGIINDFEKAMELNHIIIYIQPKYDIINNEIVGGEALVRWNHPKLGMIPPDKFIGVLEQNNYITKLDYYVWDKTCELLHKLKSENGKVLPISINVSRIDFYRIDLVNTLLELVKKYDLEPEELHIEITESVYAEDKEQIYSIIKKLQENRFVILMDDFGSGYSSLNMLKEAPVDILKLDMGFMRNTGKFKNREEIIVEAIVELSHRIEIDVIVEGVENVEQVDFLKSIGAKYIQGYYFSKPLPKEEYEKLVNK